MALQLLRSTQEETPMKSRFLAASLFAATVLPVALAQAQAPVFSVDKPKSSVKFSVKASVALEGVFKQWDATVVAKSTDPTTVVIDIEVQAASVDTGSGMKDGKLKSSDFFDVQNNPVISFKSNKVTQMGPGTFEVAGTFTIRGVSKPAVLTLTGSRAATGPSEVKGMMAFDRKDYGMNSGIPFIKIADRVEVDVDLFVNRTSGPPLALK
jgi:polyisoprenoid-binding protein YceI